MAQLTAVKHLAKKLGAVVNAHKAGRNMEVNIDAPKGKVWCATGDTHHLHTHWLIDGPAEWRWDAVVDLLERMKMGVVACDDGECDICQEEASDE